MTRGSLILNDRVLHSREPMKADYPPFLSDGRGACSDLEPEERDDFTEMSSRTYGKLARERARRVCERCPFRESGECLAWGTAREEDGIWGGEWLKLGRIVTHRGGVVRAV